MSACWVVLRKELLDAFRDRRMVIVALVVMPLAVPLILAGMSALGMKRQVEKLEEVVESIVIGQDWPPVDPNDVRVVLFVKLREGLVLQDDLVKRIKNTIRDNTTPRHVPAKVLQVADIPRTKSGKIVELAVRKVVHGQEVKNVEALANPEALEFFRGRVELEK